MYDFKPFINKAQALMKDHEIEGHFFVLSIDVSELSWFNHYYGSDTGGILLNRLHDFILGIEGVVLLERVVLDKMIILLHRKTPLSNDELQKEYIKQLNMFDDKKILDFPAAFIRIDCGIFAMRDNDVRKALAGANLAKKEARNLNHKATIIYDDETLDRLKAFSDHSCEISEGLDNDEFTFFIHPIMDVATGKAIRVEALSRWIKPDGTVITPDDFISHMNKIGAIVNLDYLILEKVCRYYSDLIKNNIQPIPVSVNLSRRHVGNENAADMLYNIVKKHNIPCDLIIFEITEDIIISSFKETSEFIDKLRSLGFKISIDDFGAGFTPLSIWFNMEFDEIKLDRMFMSGDANTIHRRHMLAKMLTTYAHELNVKIVCEGVETNKEVEFLKSIGCDMAQGFYFSKPIPPDDFYR